MGWMTLSLPMIGGRCLVGGRVAAAAESRTVGTGVGSGDAAAGESVGVPTTCAVSIICVVSLL